MSVTSCKKQFYCESGSPPMWIISFNNIIIKCQNVDKGRRGGGHTLWIRIFVCFMPFKGQFCDF